MLDIEHLEKEYDKNLKTITDKKGIRKYKRS